MLNSTRLTVFMLSPWGEPPTPPPPAKKTSELGKFQPIANAPN